MTEYVIWGISGSDSDEQILLTEIKGKKIASLDQARSLAKLLETKYGARETRIQSYEM